MTSWQSGNPVPPKSKRTMLAALNFTPAKAGLIARNTLDYTDAKGVRRVRLHNTDILTIMPRGGFIVDTGGYNTVTTRARLNASLPDGWRVYTSRGTLYLCERNMGVTQYPVRRRVTVNAKGKVSSDVTPAMLAKSAKQLDAYMKAWKAKGLPSVADSGGDPWLFTKGKVDASTMREWMQSRYVFRTLYAMALEFAGIRGDSVAYNLHHADRHGLGKTDLQRIRRYVRACLGGAA